MTLLRRLVRREPFWQAHRTHFYQRATDNGLYDHGRGRARVRGQLALVALAVIIRVVPGRLERDRRADGWRASGRLAALPRFERGQP